MYDLEAAASALAPLIDDRTVVVTLQNGVEAVDIVARYVSREQVAGGVAYVGAVISEPGVIRHTALDSLIFGEPDGRNDPSQASFLPVGLHLALVLVAGIWLPPALVSWFQYVATLLN